MTKSQHTPTPWTFSEPTPYFGNESLWYVIQNEQEENVVTVLVDATPLSDHLHEAAQKVFNAINAHDALIEALDAMVAALLKATHGDEYCEYDDQFELCNAALKLAKEG